MALKHIVFDCDGVLWEGTNEGYFRCYHAAAREAGIALDYALVKQRILVNWGQPVVREIDGMLPNHPERVPQVVDIYRRLIHSDLFLAGASLVPGADTALKTLAVRYGLSAITGMNARNLDLLLDRFHLRPLFQHVFSTGDISEPEQRKETGYHLGLLLRAEGLGSRQAIVVGDALVDVRMARQQGVPLVVVLTGHLDLEQARNTGAEAVLPSVADLPRWLDSRPDLEP